MKQLNLNGKWKVTHIPFGQSVEDTLSEDFIPEGWLDAEIPEDIHATLRRAGYLKGHFFGKDLAEESWIETVDWVYYRQFHVPASLKGKQTFLEFQGLDTFCDIYLNGMLLGRSENMHRTMRFDMDGKMAYGSRNVLVVRFHSPIRWVEGRDATGLFSTTTVDRLFARKAQMNYSWDFCGRCVTTGIWKDVALISHDHNWIDGYYLYTKEILPGKALLGFRPEFGTGVEDFADYSIRVTLSRNGLPEYQYSGDARADLVIEIPVENPALWWPRPYGEPALYDFRLELLKDGTVVDGKAQKFGIRTIEIIQEDQADGRSFIFAVNGKRIFVRGANWVPIDVIYTNIRDEHYIELIDHAVASNLSMLRVWGGGIYEPELFFRLCDEKGIMVWQDFMFACGIYPRDDAFHANVREEAVGVLRKYRNFTSLVLWCGDNENDEAYAWDGRPYDFPQEKLSRVTLKSAWEAHDPHRLYIPSSPYSPFEFYKGGDNPKSPHQGDMHIYIVSANPADKNYYRKIRGYRPRFMSEYGFLSLPGKDSYYRFNFLRKVPERILANKTSMVGADVTAEDGGCHDALIYHSQVYHAYTQKYWIEYLRRLKWTCAGSLYWKFNDPMADNAEGHSFPSLMSVVDFYGQPKMVYHFSRRAYEDVILVCNETAEHYEIWSCSELDKTLSGRLMVHHATFDGNLLGCWEQDATIEKDSAVCLLAIPREAMKVVDALHEYLWIGFEAPDCQSDGQLVGQLDGQLENRYFLVDICDYQNLKLQNGKVQLVRSTWDGTVLTVVLRADTYVMSVHLQVPDAKVSFSDNDFDLDPGREKTVAVRFAQAKGLEDAVQVGQAAGLEETVLCIEGRNVHRVVHPLCRLLQNEAGRS